MRPSPVDVLWIARYDYQKTWELRPHAHDFHQLVLFLDGRAQFAVDGEAFTIHGGECFLIRPREAHSLRADTHLKTLDVKFRVADGPLDSALARAARCLHCPQLGLAARLERIRQEGERRAPWYREMCGALFAEVLYLYLRADEESQALTRSGIVENLVPRSGALPRALDYLATRLGESMTVADMARAAGCSERTLRTHFRKVFQVGPLAYLQSRRIARAKEFMQYSDYSLKEIARQVGLQNVHHFTRLFSGVEGRSPAAWRRQYQEGIRKDVNIDPKFSNHSFVVEP